MNSTEQQPNQPRDPRDVDALPADLHDYERMTIEELREVHLQLPYYEMKGIITSEEKKRRATIAVALRDVKLCQRDLADAQRLLDERTDRLAELFAEAASAGSEGGAE